jgi:lambda repressor-like predicted transcriptional regulator
MTDQDAVVVSDERLLERLAAEADEARTATIKRDRLIVELRRRGVSLRQIGEAAGLTHAAIARIERRDA